MIIHERCRCSECQPDLSRINANADQINAEAADSVAYQSPATMRPPDQAYKVAADAAAFAGFFTDPGQVADRIVEAVWALALRTFDRPEIPEPTVDDAPPHYTNREAYAWLAGYHAAREDQ